MSEYADRHSHSHRKERVDHVLGSTKSGAVDASGYTVPGELDTQRKTGPYQPKPRAFAKGGKVEGGKAHHHAGRKSRDAGGETAIQQLRPNVPTSGLYGSGFSPTHAGLLSSAGGLKKGGDVKKRSCGGKSGERRLEMEKAAGDKRHKRDSGGQATGEAVKQARANSEYQKARSAEGNANFFTAPFKEQDTQSAMDRMGASSDRTGYDADYKRGGKAARKARAEGGRAKGKTNINIIIGAPKQDAAGPAVPPPPSAMPPKPGLPPAALGAMAGTMPPMGGPGPAAPGMPPQMPPGMGPR